MNLSNCPELIDEFTDVKIILADSEETVELNLHRNILAFNSKFFYKLFVFDRSKRSFIVRIDDVEIAKSILMLMYGLHTELFHPPWLLSLLTIKCQNYFLMDTDPNILYNLTVPAEGFDLLLETIQPYDLRKDPRLLFMLKQNLPKNFDLPIELSNLINQPHFLIAVFQNRIKIWNEETYDMINFYQHSAEITCFDISIDNNLIVYGDSCGTISSWNLTNNSHTKINSDSNHIYDITINYDNTKIAIINQDYLIVMLDLVTNTSDDKSFSIDSNNTFSLIFSPNGEMLACSGRHFYLWNLRTKIQKKYSDLDCSVYIKFTFDNKKIISCKDDSIITICDITNQEITHEIDFRYNGFVDNFSISPDGKMLVASGESPYDGVKIWNLETKLVITTQKRVIGSKQSITFSSDGTKIAYHDTYTITILDINLNTLKIIKNDNYINLLRFSR